MKHDGPFNQAKSNKWNLIDYIKFSRFSRIIDHCKFFHAVWFPSLKKEQISHMVLPSEGDKQLILTMESLYNPQEDIDRLLEAEAWVFAFPLYIDCLPSHLLSCLEQLEKAG